jgi:hypothetical protein
MKRRTTKRAGVALILVVAVLGIAAIMSYAMLSSASLQAQVGGTANLVVGADSLAESGVNYAMYYLQHPEVAPSLNSSGFYPGEAGVSIGSSTSESFDVTVSDKDRDGVTALSRNTYLITSVGRCGAITRTVYVKVYVAAKYRVVSAFSSNNDVTMPATVTLSILDDTTAGFTRLSTDPLVRCDAKYTLNNINAVTGTVASTLTNASNPMAVPQYPLQAAPTLSGASQINTLKSYTTYTYNGTVYTADQLTWDPLSENIVTSNAAANPLNVWYTTANRNLRGNCTIAGTLIVAGGKTLRISGVTTITPKPDPSTGKPVMPGLVVDKDVSFEGASRILTVNGLMWVSNQITCNVLTGTNWRLNVNGALMMPGSAAITGAPILSLFNAQMNLKYVQANVDLPDLCDKNQIPQSVKVLSWVNQ